MEPIYTPVIASGPLDVGLTTGVCAWVSVCACPNDDPPICSVAADRWISCYMCGVNKNVGATPRVSHSGPFDVGLTTRVRVYVWACMRAYRYV